MTDENGCPECGRADTGYRSERMCDLCAAEKGYASLRADLELRLEAALAREAELRAALAAMLRLLSDEDGAPTLDCDQVCDQARKALSVTP